MINIALIGKRESGKSIFLLHALSKHKISYLDTYGELFDYHIQDENIEKKFSKKYKELKKEKSIEPTLGVYEVSASLISSEEVHGDICLWEIGSGIPFDVTDDDFEKKFEKYFSETVGGKKGVFFDGYIFFEKAENFGVIEEVSYTAFRKKFSDYMKLSNQIHKPILMICTKKLNEYIEEKLYYRYKNNFKLDIGAHYNFFSVDDFSYKNILDAKYSLTYFISEIAVNENMKFYNATKKLLQDLQENIQKLRENENE